MRKVKRFKVQGYSKIRKKAPEIYQVKGKVRIESNVLEGQIQLVACYFRWRKRCRGFNRFGHLIGPSIRQRLYRYAISDTLVTVSIDDFSFIGRVISVGRNDFEVIVTDSLHSPFVQGALVTVSLKYVNAIASD